MRTARLLAVVLSALTPGALAAAPADLAGVLEPIRAQAGAPALTAALVRDGAIVAQGVVGVRRLGEETRVEPDDAFLIGSCAKSMLRMLIARLVDEGALRFDTTLSEALPDVSMRDEYRSVTLAQILEHRAGLQPYTEITPRSTPFIFSLQGEPTAQRAAFAAHLLNEEPVAPPGSRFEYSNAGYGLVACVAERTTGTPWERLVAEKLWTPLGLTTARVGYAFGDDLSGAPLGHFRTPEGWKPVPRLRPIVHAIAPAGVVSCSVRDFATFAGALCAAEAGKPGFLTAGSAGVLRDTRISTDEGVPFFGGEGTFTAAYALWPSRGVAIVVQSSAGSNDEICANAIEAVRAALAPECPKYEHPLRRSRHFALFGFRIRAVDDDVWTVGPVEPGSPADKAGLKEGDAITGFNAVPLDKLTLNQRIEALKGPKLTLDVDRSGAAISFELGARELPADAPK